MIIILLLLLFGGGWSCEVSFLARPLPENLHLDYYFVSPNVQSPEECASFCAKRRFCQSAVFEVLERTCSISYEQSEDCREETARYRAIPSPTVNLILITCVTRCASLEESDIRRSLPRSPTREVEILTGEPHDGYQEEPHMYNPIPIPVREQSFLRKSPNSLEASGKPRLVVGEPVDAQLELQDEETGESDDEEGHMNHVVLANLTTFASVLDEFTPHKNSGPPVCFRTRKGRYLLGGAVRRIPGVSTDECRCLCARSWRNAQRCDSINYFSNGMCVLNSGSHLGRYDLIEDEEAMYQYVACDITMLIGIADIVCAGPPKATTPPSVFHSVWKESSENHTEIEGSGDNELSENQTTGRAISTTTTTVAPAATTATENTTPVATTTETTTEKPTEPSTVTETTTVASTTTSPEDKEEIILESDEEDPAEEEKEEKSDEERKKKKDKKKKKKKHGEKKKKELREEQTETTTEGTTRAVRKEPESMPVSTTTQKPAKCFEELFDYLMTSTAGGLEHDVSLDECKCLCANSMTSGRYAFQCLSATYYHNERDCVLNVESRKQRPELLERHYRRIYNVTYLGLQCSILQAVTNLVDSSLEAGCIQPFSTTTTTTTTATPIPSSTNKEFESGSDECFIELPHFVLEGTAQAVETDVTVDDCKCSCATADQAYGEPCQSAQYFPDNRICLLNKRNRFSNPESFNYVPLSQQNYYESKCTSREEARKSYIAGSCQEYLRLKALKKAKSLEPQKIETPKELALKALQRNDDETFKEKKGEKKTKRKVYDDEEGKSRRRKKIRSHHRKDRDDSSEDYEEEKERRRKPKRVLKRKHIDSEDDENSDEPVKRHHHHHHYQHRRRKVVTRPTSTTTTTIATTTTTTTPRTTTTTTTTRPTTTRPHKVVKKLNPNIPEAEGFDSKELEEFMREENMLMSKEVMDDHLHAMMQGIVKATQNAMKDDMAKMKQQLATSTAPPASPATTVAAATTTTPAKDIHKEHEEMKKHHKKIKEMIDSYEMSSSSSSSTSSEFSDDYSEEDRHRRRTHRKRKRVQANSIDDSDEEETVTSSTHRPPSTRPPSTTQTTSPLTTTNATTKSTTTVRTTRITTTTTTTTAFPPVGPCTYSAIYQTAFGGKKLIKTVSVDSPSGCLAACHALGCRSANLYSGGGCELFKDSLIDYPRADVLGFEAGGVYFDGIQCTDKDS